MNTVISFFKEKVFRSNFLSIKDYICITILMLAFLFLAFFQLGDMHAPQTTYTAVPDNRDIVLDMGKYTDVACFSVFLGNLNTRHFSLSAYNEVTGAWENITGDAIAESVFAWNKIDVNYRLRYLGIVATDEEAVLNELVVLAPDGQVITPTNASDYPTLFDEQDIFPGIKTYMNSTMFDEVYHSRTAYEFIHGLITYETTHPHLGKILIAIGVKLFGMTPFGWRFMSALFGILIIPLMYVFAKRLFNSTFIATVASALITFDCMHYTLSRIGTIDIFAAFFILMMYYFLYRYFQEDSLYRSNKKWLRDAFPPKSVFIPLAMCGISMSLGIATKWTGIYAGAGLGILFLWYTFTHYPQKQTTKLFGFCCLFFIVMPLIAYTLCFIPVVGYSDYNSLLDKTIQGTQYMFQYHSTLVAEHYYSSPFYEWPVVWMPLLYANDAINASEVSAVSCMGNPVIWWLGIPCVVYVFYNWLVKRDKKAGFLCIAYAAQYIPWMSVKRITFIYHYLPAILFVFLMMAYTMQHIKERRSWGKKAITLYLVIAIACFFLFFPVISGIPINKDYGLRLRWLKDWILVL